MAKSRKELQKQQYKQLRAAGVSAAIARRFRGSSQQKIERVIKGGPNNLPEISIRHQTAAIIGNRKRGYKVVSIPWSTDPPKQYLYPFTWVLRYVLQNVDTNEILDDYITIQYTVLMPDAEIVKEATEYIKGAIERKENRYFVKNFKLLDVSIVEKWLVDNPIIYVRPEWVGKQ